MNDELKRASALIKEGKEAEAREILLQVLRRNPKDDEAWVWLASITEDREKRQKCLEEALKHNPKNEVAQRVLKKMTAPVEPAREAAPPPKKLTLMAHVLCGWPLILVIFGGAIGGALGGLAYAGNVAVYKADIPKVWKIVLNPLIGIAAIVLWFVIATLLTSVFPRG